MTPEEILAIIASEMVTDPNYVNYISLAGLNHSQVVLGDKYNMATALLAAHMWVLNTKRQGESGVVTYLADGRRMKSYGGTGVIRDSLELTNYGMQYKTLISATVVGASTSNLDTVLSGLMG